MKAISREVSSVLDALASLFSAVHKDKDNPFENTGALYQGAVMTIQAYSWGDDEQPFNFAWRDIQVKWYKYWPRGAEINREPTPDELIEMLRECSAEILGAITAKLIDEPELLKIAARHGATHKPSLGVYQFFTHELLGFSHAMQAYRRPDNWSRITEEAQPYYGKVLTTKEQGSFGKPATQYRLKGVLDGEDDYYYVVKELSSGKETLLSCVGSLESWGFDLSAVQDPSATETLASNPRLTCAPFGKD